MLESARLADGLDGLHGLGEFRERILGRRGRLHRLPVLETIDLLVSRLDVPLGNRLLDDVPRRRIHLVGRCLPKPASDLLDAHPAEGCDSVVDFPESPRRSGQDPQDLHLIETRRLHGRRLGHLSQCSECRRHFVAIVGRKLTAAEGALEVLLRTPQVGT